jgi:hypothetical protein
MNVRSGGLYLAGLVAVLMALVIAGCGSDSSNSNAEVASAISILDGAGMHEIDESVNSKKEIPPTAQNTALHMQTVLLVTGWPGDLKEPAKKMAALLGTMASTLDTPQPDMAKVGPAVKAAHDAWHDFSVLVWDYLAGKAGLEHSTAVHAH